MFKNYKNLTIILLLFYILLFSLIKSLDSYNTLKSLPLISSFFLYIANMIFDFYLINFNKGKKFQDFDKS